MQAANGLLTIAGNWCKSEQKYLMPCDFANISFALSAYLAKGISGVEALIPLQISSFSP